jgi:hypothetical protein
MIVDLYFTGSSAKVLSGEYGVSEVTIYALVKKYSPIQTEDKISKYCFFPFKKGVFDTSYRMQISTRQSITDCKLRWQPIKMFAPKRWNHSPLNFLRLNR